MGGPIIDDFSASRKSLGESPVSRLKYLPKNEGEAKLRSSLISEIRFWVELSCALVTLAMANCSPLNVTSFNATSNGVEYKYEVVVPMMNFVRVSAVTPADQLTGEVVVPSTVNYNGTNYVVSQIGKVLSKAILRLRAIVCRLPSRSWAKAVSATAHR